MIEIQHNENVSRDHEIEGSEPQLWRDYTISKREMK